MTEQRPTSGWVGDGKHYFPIRVYYEDTDAGGIVYHATYLRYAERARSELLRLLGTTHEDTKRGQGHVWAIRRLEVEYLRPGKLDDALLVVTNLIELGGASARFRQSIQRDGVEIAILTPQAILLSESGKPVRLPQELVRSFDSLLSIS